ncbi:putative teichuronic acid biosynthesis glycosyltransferase TuaC [Rubripirellula obstinata]|uniref:Putative teichuronic acid biosynthesis glycosyltransferase TuaC n=1 Tax=Rubripirellula obstinata TaxID=406547 RepID=A0A5B1CFX2_9BACT|nr:glycosyltransferase [Rubripirellula obstinata]KAA1260098.1 putative teichuronic acid biosynthesis glycosyltransferase TuaC [Rubripirellula obstinata]
MHIDFIITEMFAGGAERCLTEVACGLADRGDHVRVFSLGSLPVGQQSLLVDRLRETGIEVVSGNADSVREVIGARKRLDCFFSESPPDVCQTFMFHANTLGAFTARLRKRDTVVIGGLRVAEDRWIRNRIEAAALKRMDGLICVSESVRQFSINKLGADPNRTITIPNSVDVGRFESGEDFDVSSLGWPVDSKVILFVGRMHQQKGLDLIQKQIDRLVPKGSNRKLILIGEGPLAGSIDQWCETVGTDRVQRMPWQSDVAPLVRRCDLLLLPSRYEGMPNVVMEAMAAARPIVCSRVEGIAELLGDDPVQSFEIGDDLAMAKQVDGLLSQPEQSVQVGQLNQQRVRRDFSIAGMIDAYRSYYRKLADRRLDVR